MSIKKIIGPLIDRLFTLNKTHEILVYAMQHQSRVATLTLFCYQDKILAMHMTNNTHNSSITMMIHVIIIVHHFNGNHLMKMDHSKA